VDPVLDQRGRLAGQGLHRTGYRPHHDDHGRWGQSLLTTCFVHQGEMIIGQRIQLGASSIDIRCLRDSLAYASLFFNGFTPLHKDNAGIAIGSDVVLKAIISWTSGNFFCGLFLEINGSKTIYRA
jgi:hypothetical protein